MLIGLFYVLEVLSLISINLLVTYFVVRSFKTPAPKHPYVATPMDTPNSKPGESNSIISLTVSRTEHTLSESFLSDVGGRPNTPDLISSGFTSESSSSGSRNLESESPYHTTFGDSTSLSTPSIIISPPRQEQPADGSTSSPSSTTERVPQRQRTSLAERLSSLVDSNGRQIHLVKRSALTNITNIPKSRPSVVGDDECIEDAQCLVYRSAEEFLPAFASTPPTCNAPYSDSSFFGSSSSRFGDMFSPNAALSTTPIITLPESFKLSHFAGSMTRITGGIVTSLAAKYQNEYPDGSDDGVMIGEQFEWEDEMCALESRLGFYDKKI